MLKVLVVDDESDVRLIARMVLTAADLDVAEVRSGQEAVDALAAGPPPDVVLLDIRMPGLDGWDVLRHLRADSRYDRVGVVVFTADLSARSEAPAELREGDVLITKPFDADDLLRAVQSVLNGQG